VKRKQGFTLLEMIVATAIMAIAVVGLLSGLSGSVRSATRVREYDRAAQLAQVRMNELLLDERTPRNVPVEGRFSPQLTGGVDAGWRAQITPFKMPPVLAAGEVALDRLHLEVWWMSGATRRTVALDGYREHVLKPEEIPQNQ
jgi:type II secretion system protein I